MKRFALISGIYTWFLVAIISLAILGLSSCSSGKYTPAKINYTTKPSASSKTKKISRVYTRPMAKQTIPLEKKYIIKNTRTTSAPW